MRRLFLSLLALTVCFVALADNPKTPPPGTPIPIDPKPVIPLPLSLYADIEASYYDGVVTFVVNKDLGDSDIVVTNTTTGESWYDSVNGVCAATLALSGDEGYYEIYIYTDYGEYSGTFII